MRMLGCLLLSLLLLTGCVGAPAPESLEESPPAPISEEISAPEENDLSEVKSPDEPAEQPQTSFLRLAYLPVSAVPEQTDSLLSDYREHLAVLDALILNTGVYWDQNGALEISPAWLRTAQTLSPAVDLWCTVNPKGALVREGTAGQTLDTEEERAALAQAVADFADEHHLSGIDIDWEFPQPQEWGDFVDFLTTLNEKLGDKSLSLALYPQALPLSAQETLALTEAIDYVNIMAYDQFDQNGCHSTLQGAQEAVSLFRSMGFSPSQLILGIPAYGRPLDGSAQWVFYRDIDPNAVSPDDPNRMGTIWFNSPQLVRQKVALAHEEQLAGVMLYHLLCDRTDTETLTLCLSPES
jgi:hypothetical protein